MAQEEIDIIEEIFDKYFYGHYKLKKSSGRLRENGGHPHTQYSLNINPKLTSAVRLKKYHVKEIKLAFEPVKFSYHPKESMAVVVNNGTPSVVYLNSPDGVKNFVNMVRSAVWKQLWNKLDDIEEVKNDLVEFCEEFGRFQWYLDEA